MQKTKLAVNSEYTKRIISSMTGVIYFSFGVAQFSIIVETLNTSTAFLPIINFVIATVVGFCPVIGSMVSIYLLSKQSKSLFLISIFIIPIIFSAFLAGLFYLKNNLSIRSSKDDYQ